MDWTALGEPEQTVYHASCGLVKMNLTPRDAQYVMERDREVYCVILTHPLTEGHPDSAVIVCTRPLRAIFRRNQDAMPHRDHWHDKAPYIYPEFIAGPFASMESVMAFSDRVVRGRRGIESKVWHACAYADEWQVPCYHIDKEPEEGTAAYLSRAGAPAEYLHAYARLERTGERLLHFFAQAN